MDLTDAQLDRYARHIILRQVGGPGQKKLLSSRVLIVGAGGLGSPLALYLAAAGVGTIGIVDDDKVTLSNLQRQIIHATSDVGRLKTESSTDALTAINPDVRVEAHPVRLTAENAREIVSGYDLIADGCDNFETRFLVNDACFAEQKVLVSAALSQFDGQVATFKPFAGDDLPCYRCFVHAPPNEQDGGFSCSENGILGAIAGVVGSLQAVEVLKELLNIGDSLAGKLLIYDALSTRNRLIGLPRDPECSTCGSRA